MWAMPCPGGEQGKMQAGREVTAPGDTLGCRGGRHAVGVLWGMPAANCSLQLCGVTPGLPGRKRGSGKDEATQFGPSPRWVALTSWAGFESTKPHFCGLGTLLPEGDMAVPAAHRHGASWPLGPPATPPPPWTTAPAVHPASLAATPAPSPCSYRPCHCPVLRALTPKGRPLLSASCRALDRLQGHPWACRSWSRAPGADSAVGGARGASEVPHHGHGLGPGRSAHGLSFKG